MAFMVAEYLTTHFLSNLKPRYPETHKNKVQKREAREEELPKEK